MQMPGEYTGQTFERRLELQVSASKAFAWHELPGALERLIPPWADAAVLKRGDGIRDGSLVEMLVRLGPSRLRWVAKHHGYRRGEEFCDTQVSGPFARWEHRHSFTDAVNDRCVLTDHIEYEVPGGAVGRLLGTRLVQRKVATMFEYRHNTTRDDLAAHAQYAARGTLHVAVSGSSGLVGSTLVPLLTTGGHQVTRLVRGQAREGEVTWDPSGEFDGAVLDGIEAVVHLAGENIAAGRWTASVKERIRTSRVQGTRLLCEGLANATSPPKVLVCASAIGFYGDRGDEELTEKSSGGSGFLPEVVREWEAATQPARDAGIRVVNLRFGVILSPRGGALAKMLLPFKLGVGGRVGSGRQYWSWISIDDAAGAIYHALMTDALSGPVNAVAPNPATNAEFTRTLGRVLRRPTVFPMPAFAARLALGQMADELLLASARVVPRELQRTDYHFRQPTLEAALRHVLGREGQTISAMTSP
jgi:uncharacterized protein (TIGR01777 family)